MISFASDNYASVCPEIMHALMAANQNHASAYGADPLTDEAVKVVQNALETEAPVYFVFNGTAANTLALKSSLRSYDSVICADTSHLHTHEVAAPINACGVKFLVKENVQGKLRPEDIRLAYTEESRWGRHSTRPRLVTISQPTEFGTVYTLDELQVIRQLCDELDLLLHIDGCRLYNAADALGCSLADTARFADVLSLGGTKAGLMFGEAIVFFNEALAEGFEYLQKQGLQLNSKMRFGAVQFKRLLEDDLWHRLASHSNAMAQRMWQGLSKHDGVKAFCPVETNQLFVYLPADVIAPLQEDFPFYTYDETTGMVRLITSHDTTIEQVDAFLQRFHQLAAG
ncbi:threonine aldolase family protein [Spongorhabdus nitratireducens]